MTSEILVDEVVTDGDGTTSLSPPAGKAWWFKEWRISLSSSAVGTDLLTIQVKESGGTVLSTVVIDSADGRYQTVTEVLAVGDGMTLEIVEGSNLDAAGEFVHVMALGAEVDSD